MISMLFDLFLGCRHKRLTRPITPVQKPGEPPTESYVACLECGRQFKYDVKNMRMGEAISIPGSV